MPYKLNNRDTYVKKVRIRADDVKSPIFLKKHTNVVETNSKDYKQWYYVVNEENYLVALYRGKDSGGKRIADCRISNLLDSVKNKLAGKDLYPICIEKGNMKLPLYKVLKIGKCIILQENFDEDVLALPAEQLWKRIFRVAGLSKSGNYIYVMLSHIVSANPWKYISGEHQLDEYVEFRRYQVNNFIGLIEGTDFTISPAGEIIPR